MHHLANPEVVQFTPYRPCNCSYTQTYRETERRTEKEWGQDPVKCSVQTSLSRASITASTCAQPSWAVVNSASASAFSCAPHTRRYIISDKYESKSVSQSINQSTDQSINTFHPLLLGINE